MPATGYQLQKHDKNMVEALAAINCFSYHSTKWNVADSTLVAKMRYFCYSYEIPRFSREKQKGGTYVSRKYKWFYNLHVLWHTR
jgi:hypothetical protein